MPKETTGILAPELHPEVHPSARRTITPNVRGSERPIESAKPVQEPLPSITPAPPRMPFVLDVSHIDFGTCPYGSRRKVETIAPRPLILANNTDTQVACVWACPPGAFSISPSSATLEPRTTTTFTVTFQPPIGDTAHATELECYLGHADSHAPSFFAVSVVGHTFSTPPNVQVSFSVREVECAPTHTGVPTFRTFHVINEVSKKYDRVLMKSNLNIYICVCVYVCIYVCICRF